MQGHGHATFSTSPCSGCTRAPVLETLTMHHPGFSDYTLKKKIKLKILYPQAPAFSQLANVIVANNENRCAYTTLIPDVENSVITL